MGTLILAAPVTAVAGSLLFRGDARCRLVVALLDYVVITVGVCMLDLAVVKVMGRLFDSDIRALVLTLEAVLAIAVVLVMRGRMVPTVRGFMRGDSASAGPYLSLLAPIAVCIAVCLVLWLYDPFTDSTYAVGICLASSIAFVVVIRTMFIGIGDMASMARRDAELGAARDIQMSAIPDGSSVSWMLGPEIASVMEPAREVAGDFVDYFPIGDRRIGLVVADVSGKGIPAALFMMRSRSVIRDRMRSSDSLTDAVSSANRALCADNPSCMFVTAFMGVLDLGTGSLEYVCAGHPAPFVRTSEGVSRLEGGRGPMMGFADVGYRSDAVGLKGGDAILAFTDGVTEAEARGTMLGEGCVAEVLSSGGSPEVLVRDLMERIDVFLGGSPRTDDVTLLALRYRPTSSRVFDAVAGGCRDAVSWVSGQCPPAVSMRAELIAEELFLNVVHHAYSGRGGGLRIIAMPGRASVALTFIDEGLPFDPTLPRPRTDDGPGRAPGGEGLNIVRSMSSSMAYRREDGRNILTVVLEERE